MLKGGAAFFYVAPPFAVCNSLLETAQRSPKGQVKLVLLWGFSECGNCKTLRLRAQGVYSYK